MEGWAWARHPHRDRRLSGFGEAAPPCTRVGLGTGSPIGERLVSVLVSLPVPFSANATRSPCTKGGPLCPVMRSLA